MLTDILFIVSGVAGYLVLGLNVALFWRQHVDPQVGTYGLGCILLFWPIVVVAYLICELPRWFGRLVVWLDASGEY